MKIRLTAFLASALALSSMQVAGLITAIPTDSSLIRDPYSSGTFAYSADIENAYSGSWLLDFGSTNSTDGGEATFTRGAWKHAGDLAYSEKNDDDVKLFIRGDISGYIAAIVNGDSDLVDLNTSITADPEVIINSSKRAIMLFDRSSTRNRSLGNWSFTGGTYVGANEAAFIRTAGDLNFDSVAFIAGGDGHSGVYIGNADSLTITNSRERTDIVYQASDVSSGYGGYGIYFGGEEATISGGGSFTGSEDLTKGKRSYENVVDGVSDQIGLIEGGMGAYFSGTATFTDAEFGEYNFTGQQAGQATVGGDTAFAYAIGGHGLYAESIQGTFSNATFQGGIGGGAEIVKVKYLDELGEVFESADNALALAHGGSGLLTTDGSLVLTDSSARGGAGGLAIAQEAGSFAVASGGNGVAAGGELTISGGSYKGGQAGSAISREGEAYANGGNGVYFRDGEMTIDGGTFTGAKGGIVTTENTGVANGGAGVLVEDGTLTINGGTFTGADAGKVNGVKQTGNVGVWAQNSDLTINDAGEGTSINGDVYFSNDDKTFALNGGTITGDIRFEGTEETTFTVNSNAVSQSGSIIQNGGTVNVNNNLGTEDFFKNVEIDGTMNFSNTLNSEGGSFSLANGSTLVLDAGANLSGGTKISVGYGEIASDDDIDLSESSSISLSYNGLANEMGSIDLGANSLVFSDDTGRLNISGAAATATGSVQFVSGGATSFSTNADTHVKADLGWLVNETVDGSAGILVDWTYNSLTNSSLNDLDSSLLVSVDGILTNLSTSEFFALNSSGENEGASRLRYSLSQIPDVSESSFQISRQVNEQIASRGTEYRSANGFASSKPSFGKAAQPTGVAGPDAVDENTMQGWVRAYGSTGDKDATDSFAAYDSSSWGSIIGVDKSFGNLLIGIAGGYARTDLDAGSTYKADVDTYHGSVYSTIAGEKIFVDLAGTYGVAKTEESNAFSPDGNKFDSDIYSLYIGGGIAFDVKEAISITPEASFLASFYSQEKFDRTGTFGGTVDEYDTESYLSSIGLTIAMQQTAEWLNRGIAFIPEVRAHWLHEFNSDPDSFMYTIGGVTAPSAVRPRDEDLLRLGAGFDIWSWDYQSTKFELDYDGLFSSTYNEHIVSGKLTLQF